MSSEPPERLGRTLGFRLALWYAVLFITSSLTLVALAYWLVAYTLQQRDRDVIETTLVRYATAYQQGGLDLLNRTIASDRSGGAYEPLLVRALSRDEEAIFLSVPTDWSMFDLTRLSTPPLPGRGGWTELTSRDGQMSLEVATVRTADGALLQVGKSSERRLELLGRFRRLVFMLLASILVIGLTGGAILTRSALRPVNSLISTVQSILDTGRLDRRVTAAPTGDPLDELGVLFNRMLDRIQGLIDGMRGALDNVAHDLRTPVMRVRARAEATLQTDDAGPATREALADCIEESDRLVTMLDALMDISEAETGVLRLALEPLQASQLVHDAIELYDDLADEKSLTLTSVVPDDVYILGDRTRLRQVLANLLDNAVKYTPRSGRVSIDVSRRGDLVAFTVVDNGIGIPAEELPRVWERLYRGDKSRSERGLGLGLSLVRAIVEAHHGRVDVTSEPGRGSSFTVLLPIAPIARELNLTSM
jgi:signal transduction histidine kinase